ncbi:MAG TPA: hypothetical protein VK196_09350 [Magnetospirillum sp.]|nr:hypothetical protein [Magnetospirillum sp.]
MFTEFKSWKFAHATAIAAWIMNNFQDDSVEYWIAADWLQSKYRYLKDKSSGKGRRGVPSLSAYALAALSGLNNIPDRLQHLRKNAKDHLEKMRDEGSRVRSRERISKIISTYVINSHATIDDIIHLEYWLCEGKSRPRRFPATRSAFINALATSLSIFREYPGDAYKKIHALSLVNSKFYESKKNGEYIIGWEKVYPFILDSIFFWPLLVVEGSAASVSGISLPLLIMPNKSEVGTGEAEVKRNFISLKWQKSVDIALRAARDLTLLEDDNFNRNIFIERGVSIDTAPVEAILQEFSTVEMGEQISFQVEGRSAELPLALGIFSKINGLHYPLASVSSGIIDDENLSQDRIIIGVAGINEKLAWVNSAKLFESVLLPPSAYGVNCDNVVFCDTLSRAADYAFRRQWRKMKFVRCYDILKFAASGDWSIYLSAALAEIKGRSEKLLVLDGVDIRGVVGLFNYINGEVRNSLQETAPSLSVAYIRVVESESENQLLGILSEVCGAPWHLLDRITCAANIDKKIEVAKNIFRQGEFLPGAPAFRAPDVFVLILPRHIIDLYRCDALTDSVEHQRWRNIISILSNIGSAVGVLTCRAGNGILTSRFVVVSDYESNSDNDAVLDNICADRSFIWQLSIFRFGFSFLEAAQALPRVSDVGAMFKRLEGRGVLVNASDVWIMPLRKKYCDEVDSLAPQKRIEMHLLAAKAKVAFLYSGNETWCTIPSGGALEAIHEAVHHLVTMLKIDESLLYRERRGVVNLIEEASDLISVIYAHLDCLGWEIFEFGKLLKRSILRSDYILSRAEKLFSMSQGSVIDRKYIDSFLRCVEFIAVRNDKEKERIADLIMGELGCVSSISVCDELKLHASILSRVRTSRPKLRDAIDGWLERAIQHDREVCMAISPKWFEERGDVEGDHALAAAWYSLGIKVSPWDMDNWLKYVYCSTSGDARKEFGSLLETDKRKAMSAIMHMNNNLCRDYRWRGGYAKVMSKLGEM